MGRRLTIVLDTPTIGHNSLSADFVYPRGVQAPHVTGRERGVIPGCVAAKDFEPGIPIQQVLECADEMA